MEVLNESDLDEPLGNVTGFEDDLRTIGVAPVSCARLFEEADAAVAAGQPETEPTDCCCDFGNTGTPVTVFAADSAASAE